MKKFILKHLEKIIMFVVMLICFTIYWLTDKGLTYLFTNAPMLFLIITGFVLITGGIFMLGYSIYLYIIEKHQRIDCTIEKQGEIVTYHENKPIIKIDKERSLSLDTVLDKTKHPIGSTINVLVNENMTNIYYPQKGKMLGLIFKILFSVIFIIASILALCVFHKMM